MSITLPEIVADAIGARVASGRYGSESEVVEDGLRALADRERGVEDWLTGVVAADYAAWQGGTLDTIAIADVRAEFAGTSDL